MRTTILLLVGCAVALFCQSFDVISVRPATEPVNGRTGKPYIAGGPGTDDPLRFSCIGISMAGLLFRAFSTGNYYKIYGPEWIDTEHYDIAVKIPEGTTKEQFRVMLQNLLYERFQLKLHHETRDLPSYELLVAKRGPRLKETTFSETGAAAPEKPGPRKLDMNGFPILDRANVAMVMNGQVARLTAKAQTMSRLATLLVGQMQAPIVDKTGLTGKYDFTLEFAPGLGGDTTAAVDSLPPLESALQEQLGLRLEAKKLPADVIVIDRIDRVPTAN